MNILQIIKEELSLFEVSDKLYDLLKKNYSNSRLIMKKIEKILSKQKKYLYL